MKHRKTLIATGLLIGIGASTAQASLTPYTSDGKAVVYDNVTNITWTGDANLLGTLEASLGYNTVVNAIIAASPIVNDTPNVLDTPSNSGHHNVTSSDFSSGGHVSWFGARAFTSYLNSINYAGSNQWSLPSAGTNPQAGYNQNSGQFAELFYDELNALAYPGSNGSNFGISQDGLRYHPSVNVGPFTNAQSSGYWLGTEYASQPQLAWSFDANFGHLGYSYKAYQYSNYVWAISPGNIAAVPVPAAMWLFGSAMLGFLGVTRHRAA